MLSLKNASKVLAGMLTVLVLSVLCVSDRALAQEDCYSYITSQLNSEEYTELSGYVYVYISEYGLPTSEASKIIQYYTDLKNTDRNYYWIDYVSYWGNDIIYGIDFKVKSGYIAPDRYIEKEEAKEDFDKIQSQIASGEWKEIVKDKILDTNNEYAGSHLEFTLTELKDYVSAEEILAYVKQLLSEPEYYYIESFYSKDGYSYYMSYRSGCRDEDFKLNMLKEFVTLQSIYCDMIDEKMTDVEKVLAIHEFVARECEYDYQNYLDDTIPNQSYQMQGVINNGLAVCSGYTSAMSYFLERAGIKAESISSSEMNHAWNAVCLDGKYYHVDTTWDDWGKNENYEGEVYHKYFLKSDDEFNGHHCCWSSYDGETGDSGSYSNYIFRYNETSRITYSYYNGFWYYKNGNNDILKSKIDGTQKSVFKSFDESIVNVYIYKGYMYVATGTKVYKINMSNASNVSIILNTLQDDAMGNIDEFVIKQGRAKIDSGRVSRYISLNNSSISLNKTSANMIEGQSLSLTATYSSEYGSKVIWASTQPQIVSVDSNGKLTAKGNGTAIIVAAVDGKLATCEVTSKEKLEIRFNVNGGKTLTEKNKIVVTGNAIGTLPTPKRTGYTFKGWYTAKTGGSKIYKTTKITKNMTLYARWSKNKYTVSFNANGGKVSTASKKVYYSSKIGTLPTPKRTGYIFKGWYTAKTGGSKVYTTKKITKDMTLYARWSKNKYTVKFNANGGKVTTTSKKVYYGAKVGTLPTPKRTGYIFKGWYTAKTGGNKVYTTKKVTKNTTLYARWSKNKYTVKFNANGGKVTTTSKKVYYGAKVGTLPTPKRTGYTFKGWYTAKTGGTKVYTSKVIKKNVVLYARWVKK